MDLSKKRCVPCEGSAVPLFKKEADALLTQLSGWTLAEDGKSISKSYRCKDFAGAVAFVNKITPVAEAEGHHPDLSVSWGRVGVELSTHAIGGLSENDFILAAKIDELVV
jgi:4a-hydroxytetrahydrobiopterin dehydratase